jgi:hypothetical protein
VQKCLEDGHEDAGMTTHLGANEKRRKKLSKIREKRRIRTQTHNARRGTDTVDRNDNPSLPGMYGKSSDKFQVTVGSRE